MDATPRDDRRWPRIVLTLPPDLADDLRESARLNLRDTKREALRLLRDAIERERAGTAGAVR
jgi:hypothetical protein